jgi:hypothetical protein
VTPNLGSGGKDKPESEESQIGHFMIPTSVAAAVGSLLLITAAITVAACVCYHWRKQKGGCTYNIATTSLMVVIFIKQTLRHKVFLSTYGVIIH